jgi:membrane-bound ClpP family serine protease
MHWLLIATFIVIGLLFLVLEILVIPGAGFAGIVGFILISIGIWQSYAVFGATAGHLVLGGTFLLTVITLVLSLRGRTWRKLMLSTEIDGKVNMIDAEKIRVGDAGKTISRLAPMGKALINGEFYEVRTDGTFIDQHTEIVVDKIEFNKIYVKRKDQDHG